MRRARLVQLGNLAFWALVAAAAIYYVVPKWRELGIGSRWATLTPGWILAGAALLILQYLVVFLLWCALVGVLGGQVQVGKLFHAFTLSLLPKYVPGKIVGLGLRTRLAANAGIGYPIAVASLGWETLLTVASAALLALAMLTLGISTQLGAGASWLLLGCVLSPIVGLAILWIPGLRTIGSQWLRLETVLGRWRSLAKLFLGYAGSWVLYAGAHWLVAQSITTVPGNLFLPLLAALCGAWILGTLTIVAPAGLGVREGLLFLFARGAMGAPNALLFVTLSRLIIFAVEMLLTLIGWASMRIRVMELNPSDSRP